MGRCCARPLLVKKNIGVEHVFTLVSSCLPQTQQLESLKIGVCGCMRRVVLEPVIQGWLSSGLPFLLGRYPLTVDHRLTRSFQSGRRSGLLSRLGWSDYWHGDDITNLRAGVISRELRCPSCPQPVSDTARLLSRHAARGISSLVDGGSLRGTAPILGFSAAPGKLSCMLTSHLVGSSGDWWGGGGGGSKRDAGRILFRHIFITS